MKMTNFNQLHCGGGGKDNNETKKWGKPQLWSAGRDVQAARWRLIMRRLKGGERPRPDPEFSHGTPAEFQTAGRKCQPAAIS